jgi:hypothetical protein
MANLGRFTLRDEGKYVIMIFQNHWLWTGDEDKARQNINEGAKGAIRGEKGDKRGYKLTLIKLLRIIHNDKYYYYRKHFL